VWARWGETYRTRAAILLGINVLLFIGVGVFAYWLRSGVVFAPLMDGYFAELARTLFPSGAHSITLGDLLLDPISIEDVPMQIPIVGLLLAALISIPILVSILYKFWSALPFIAVVGLVALMPWLAITLLFSCVIASVKPFRSSFRFTSALLGLVPATIYLILASAGTVEAFAGRLDPIERMKFIAPWVFAIVAAALAFAIVLTLARLVKHRPGVIAPLLAIMFTIPVVLFEVNVGRDELYYRLLEDHSEWAFADIDTSRGLEEAVRHAYWTQPLPKRSYEQIRESVTQTWQFELASDLAPRRTVLTRHKEDYVRRCDSFLVDFAQSRYSPNVLYLKARALDMRVDEAEFLKTRWIRFYDDFPNDKSEESWRVLLENVPRESPLRAVATLRIAQLDTRHNRIERAVAKLGEIIADFDTDPRGDPADNPPLPLIGVLDRQSPEASLHIPLQRMILEAHSLLDLLKENNDPVFGYDPICGSPFDRSADQIGMLHLDPRSAGFVAALEGLKTRYRRCELEDNIDLAIAKAQADPNRAVALLDHLVQRFSGGDAAAEALFRLGVAYQRTSRPEEARDSLKRLILEFPDSIWARQARAHMHVPISRNDRDTTG